MRINNILTSSLIHHVVQLSYFTSTNTPLHKAPSQHHSSPNMYDRSFAWDNAKNWTRRDRRNERLWLVVLLLAALLLFTINLGDLPLRDWDEGIVAQVAREIWRLSDSWRWLYPTLDGEPYLKAMRRLVFWPGGFKM